ncbi:fumarate hydratase C-terminal domain-containing protein [Azoarcus sp. PA01]|nr:fumarate hydratase C-terminal domain-containing protein [Azoarcus sp. PA01]
MPIIGGSIVPVSDIRRLHRFDQPGALRPRITHRLAHRIRFHGICWIGRHELAGDPWIGRAPPKPALAGRQPPGDGVQRGPFIPDEYNLLDASGNSRIDPGGCAVLAATKVEEIERAEWQDLGMPETLWVNRVKEFGPLIISIDTKGTNLIEQNKARFNERKNPAIERIKSQVRFIK